MEAKQMLDAGRVEVVDREMVMGYLGRLGGVLQYGTPAERKTFLKSLIQSIEVNNSEATVRYSLPLPSEPVPMDPRVLAIVHDGGPERTELRTCIFGYVGEFPYRAVASAADRPNFGHNRPPKSEGRRTHP